ncbi:MAG: hypothetical protein LQ340_000925 [Diploschistes diacapsis]|nr:MAG: hypothetical protein LQ340_000925 [Diploschistes diacapsis]
MPTIPNPPSASLFQIPLASASSSRRTSLDTTTRSSTVSSPSLQPSNPPVTAPQPQARRNRAALRDFYGLKNPPTQHPDGAKEDSHSQGIPPDGSQISSSELDTPGFDAQAYVKGVLEREGLEGVLKSEWELVGEIKSLDGDRKALVYDNYSKLITATDTIRRMRANMDPLAPHTSTLAPAISHIAGTAEALAAAMKQKVAILAIEENGENLPSSRAKRLEHRERDGEDADVQRRTQEMNTVEWVLGAPGRFRRMDEEGKKEAAKEDWQEVKLLLQKWQARGVGGALELLERCRTIMEVES